MSTAEAKARSKPRAREKAKAEGRCISCIARPVKPGCVTCVVCIDRSSARTETRVAVGKCPTCGATPEPGYIVCSTCRTRASNRCRQERARRREAGLCTRMGCPEKADAGRAECQRHREDSSLRQNLRRARAERAS